MMTAEATSENGTTYEFIRAAVFSLAACVLSMAGFWMVYAKDLVKRDDVMNMVRNEIAIDRNNTSNLATELKNVTSRLEAVSNSMVDLKVQISILNTRLEENKKQRIGANL